MALTKEERRKLDDTHDLTRDIKVVLLGTNGDNGLVGEFHRVAKSHYNLKRNYWILVGVLVGSGLLSGGIVGLVKLAA